MHATLRLKNETVAPLSSFLISRGIPLPPGITGDVNSIGVRSAEGVRLPSSARALQCRPDGSIEWAQVDILVSLKGEESTNLCIDPQGGGKASASVPNPVTVTEAENSVTLANGISRMTIPLQGSSLIKRWETAGKVLLDESGMADLEVINPGGKIFRASLDPERRVSVVHSSPLRAVVRIEGRHVARDGARLLDYALELTLTADGPDLRMDHTFYCREDVEGKVLVKAIQLRLVTNMEPSAEKVIRQSHHGQTYFPREVVIQENMEIVASSVGDINNYNMNYQPFKSGGHTSAGGNVFLRDMDSLHENPSEYPFHMRPGASSGFRADLQIGGLRQVYPFVGWREQEFTLVTIFERWRQLHPKSIAIDENTIVYGIWPSWSVPLELVRGVSKTHTILFCGVAASLGADAVEHQVLRWEVSSLDPVDISMDPAWPAHCNVLDCGDLLRYQPDKYPLLENLIQTYPAAGNPGRFTYDRHSPSGMLNYGDAGGPGWTNNEDDIRVFFPLIEYLRTGNTYCFDVGKEAARHYMEVDFCEWSTDPRQCGGFIAHTTDHFVGSVYPSHQWAEGILAYYYLTGDERARKAVIACGDNNCYWAENVIEAVCCDGREAGMPLVNLAAAYRLTGDEKYMRAARMVIDNFHRKWFEKYGDLKYPYPQGAHLKIISGYGDWSSYYGLYRLYEVSGDESIRSLLTALLEKWLKPESFNLNDARAMDFFSAWAYIQLTGDRAGALEKVASVAPMLLRRGGHPLRRLHFLKIMDEEGLIDEQQVGNRAGSI